MSERVAAICDAKDPRCPRCGRSIGWVTSALGSFFATCKNRLPRELDPGNDDRRRCGQHMLISGAPEGLCIILPLTREEFQRYHQKDLKARNLYFELGLFPTDPPMAKVRSGSQDREAT